MNLRLSLFCIALALLASNVAEAQHLQTFGDQYNGQPAYSGQILGGGIGPQSDNRHGLGTAGAGHPGRFWLQSNTADKGLGYEGSYLTLGCKNRLFEDHLDGRWLIEGQIHTSIEEDGGFFSNIGIERIFSIDAANADVSMSFWYDFDNDTQGNFAHTFHQVGASAQIKTPHWDFIGNGYFPVGVQDYTYGDLSGVNCFVGNDIVIMPGIDSALEGFDLTLRKRPEKLAIINGTIDIGAYQYSSEIIKSFAGGRVRFGFQAFRGMIVNAELNHDDRFNTTGVFSVGWLFGANASGHGHEYSKGGRDLEHVVRNDHIVRFNQDVVLAIDPDTGLAYNAVHVNNTADDAVEDGTIERPFDDLVTAAASSAPGDVIVVNGGDGTDFNMDAGIVLQDDQFLIGNGQEFLLPVAGGTFFRLCAHPNGIKPTISNDGGSEVVTLANNNVVANLSIDATDADYGIHGDGVDGGSILDNMIANADFDNVLLEGVTGDWTVNRNMFTDGGRDGFRVLGTTDTTSVFDVMSNTATGNVFDGIHFEDFDAAEVNLVSNTTNSNVRHGLFLEDYANASGTGVITVVGHTADGNLGNGILAETGSGDLILLDSLVTNNASSGVLIHNWSSTPTTSVLVGTTAGGTSEMSSNGAFANLRFLLDSPGILTNAVVTGQKLDTGNRGLAARVEGVDGLGVQSTLNIDIVDNVSFNSNLNEGIRLLAKDSGIVNARITNLDSDAPVQIIDNAFGGGAGINLIAEGGTPFPAAPASEMNVLIENVEISNILSPSGAGGLVVSTDGIFIGSTDNAVVDVEVRDALIGVAGFAGGRNTQNGVRIDLDNNHAIADLPGLINRIELEDLTLFSNVGVSLITGDDTYSDFSLVGSTIRPDGAQSTVAGPDDGPFSDGNGFYGVFVRADGLGVNTTFPGPVPPAGTLVPNMNFPNSETGSFEVVSDGVLDNRTRVAIIDNSIRDFTFNGASIETTGDAQMALALIGNRVENNGAGLNNDADNDNVFNEQPIVVTAAPDQLFFHDGVDINAFDESKIATRISNNLFRDNFERGLSLNTFNTATINALMTENVFFSNDRGEDVDNVRPPIGVGDAFEFDDDLVDSGIYDFEAINNEEYYFRDYESLILIAGDDGTPIDTGGVDIPDDTIGVFYPGNGGVDIFGDPVSIGTATLNLDMSNNSFQLGVDLRDFAAAPGDFTLGLDGTTNGFGPGFFGITDAAFGFTDPLLAACDADFLAEGFPFLIH